MIKTISKTLGLALLLFTVTINAQTTFKANTDNAKINWKGFKPTGDHYGTINLKNGSFTTNNNQITSGEFTIDMNSIVNLDMDATSEWNTKLVNHLKSEDFFDVKKYPTATFKITSTEKKGNKILVKGNLIIKNKSNPIEFLATIKIENNQLVFDSEIFKIDRSKWGIEYKSKSFFNDLADKFIYDDMEISITIKANK